MIRKALIPAAGRGARLDRPGTPKPLVDVGGQPMIFRLLGQLERAGIEQVVLVVGYEGEKVARAVTRHPGLKLDIQVVQNADWDKGLAGSLLTAKKYLNEPFIIAMADHVFDESLIVKMTSRLTDALDLIALLDCDLEKIYDLDSAVKVNLKDQKIEEIGVELKNFNAVDAGMFIANHGLFDFLELAYKEDVYADLSDAIRLIAAKGRVEVVKTNGASWDDVDTPSGLVYAEMRLRQKVRTHKLKKTEGGSPSKTFGKKYDFVVGNPEVIDIVVGRGLVNDPHRIALIPDSSASSPIFVFTDETVNKLYGEAFAANLKKQGYDVQVIVLPDGEESKSIANYVYLVERVLSRGVDERSVFVSLGGGVVCNVCGFVASTIYRGLDLVHLPTTLMAQCDAAISHKQAINATRGKNMIGSYYKPRLVAVDVEVLSTLPDRLKGDGLAEVIKHAIGQDPAYVEMLLDHSGDRDDIDFLERVVQRNVELKCELAAHDPKETAEGMILQYGHTVGHAVEHLSGYSFYHGESVAIGMMVAARVSRLLGGCSKDLVDLHERLCRHFKLPTLIPVDIEVQSIIDSLKYNKKYLVEGTRMALLTDVGRLWSVNGDYAIPVSDEVLAEACRQTQEG